MIRKSLLFLYISTMLGACAPAVSSTPAPVVAEATSALPTQGGQETSTVSPSDGSFNACSLITPAEAEQVLGTTTGAGDPENTPPVYSCTYETSEFDLVDIVVVIYDDITQAQDAYQTAIDINGYPEISGLGDRAYNAQPIFDVNVLIGKIEVSVDISDSTDDQTQLQKAVELARIALERLP